MKLLYTPEAKDCLRRIADYLKKSELNSSFIVNYIQELRRRIRNLLTAFPEVGTLQLVDGLNCRRVVIKNYSVLYSYEPNKDQIQILFIYKQNLPKLQG